MNYLCLSISQETLLGVSVNVTNEFGTSVVPWRHYRRTHGRGYMCTLPSNYSYSVTWNLIPEHNVDTTFYSAGMYIHVGVILLQLLLHQIFYPRIKTFH